MYQPSNEYPAFAVAVNVAVVALSFFALVGVTVPAFSGLTVVVTV